MGEAFFVSFTSADQKWAEWIGAELRALGHEAFVLVDREEVTDERALAIREKALGPAHLDTADTLNNLGALSRTQGDFAGARRLIERALAIRQKTLGPQHPDTAISLNNLATLLSDQGDPAAAHPLFERAHAILTKSLGPDHPNTQRVAAHIARLPPPDFPPA